MSLDELKLQVENGIQQLLMALKGKERDALDFIISVVRKLIKADFKTLSLALLQSVRKESSAPYIVREDVKEKSITQVRNPPPLLESFSEETSLNDERPSSPSGCCDRVSPTQWCSQRLKTQKRSVPELDAGVISQVDANYISSDREHSANDAESTHKINNKLTRKCFICAEKLRSRTALLHHLTDHAGAGASCRICRRTFNNLTAYTLHLKLQLCVASSQPGRQFVFRKVDCYDVLNAKDLAVCPYCAQSFVKTGYLRRHMKNVICHKREDQHAKKFNCPHCKHLFPTQEMCHQHVQSIHSHKCTKCAEVFPTVLLMKAHRLTHVNNYKCNMCTESFTTRNLLRTHRRESHTTAHTQHRHSKYLRKELKCKLCNWKTNRQFNMTRHLQSKHKDSYEDKRTFACDQCPTVLRSWETLKNHITAHSEDCAYICDHCNKGFKYRSVLKRHILRYISSPVFKCPRCANTFGRKDHLVRHEREVHDMIRKSRVKTHEQKPPAVKGVLATEAGRDAAEPQFLSLLDVQSGEMFTVPSQYAYNYLMVDATPAPLAGQETWEGMAQTAVPEVSVQYADNIVLLTNVHDLSCLPP